MKAIKVEILVVDHDNLGVKGVKETFENTCYPNHCMYPVVMSAMDADIGEWRDAHPLNHRDKIEAEYNRLFYDEDQLQSLTQEPEKLGFYDGEWIAWHGGSQPVGDHLLVEVRLRDDDLEKNKANLFVWTHLGDDCDIVSYRIIE
jgi:hypothetical protein